MIRRTVEIFTVAAIIIFGLAALYELRTFRTEQQELRAALATQQHLVDAANHRESERESSLEQELESIQKLKKQTRKPSDILDRLPRYLPLPQPLTLQRAPSFAAPASDAEATTSGAERDGSTENGAAGARESVPGAAQDVAVRPAARSAGSGVELPLHDLKPLFDFVQDCRACNAELAAAEKNRTDDAAKIAALTRQRDVALSAARGGAFWHRLQHELEWFAAGAISGYLARRR